MIPKRSAPIGRSCGRLPRCDKSSLFSLKFNDFRFEIRNFPFHQCVTRVTSRARGYKLHHNGSRRRWLQEDTRSFFSPIITRIIFSCSGSRTIVILHYAGSAPLWCRENEWNNWPDGFEIVRNVKTESNQRNSVYSVTGFYKICWISMKKG